MLSFLSNTRVYLAAGATELRKSFDTLAGVVRNSLRLDPLSGHLFVFTNARKNRLKILFWDKTGREGCKTSGVWHSCLAGIAGSVDGTLKRGTCISGPAYGYFYLRALFSDTGLEDWDGLIGFGEVGRLGKIV